MTGVRIAQIAPIARPVAPDTPSSIEQVVWVLTEELVRRGHQVTLFASGDSVTSARLVARYPRSYRGEPDLWRNWQFHEGVHTAAALEHAGEFDVVHSHVYAFPAPLCRLVDTPVVHTDHCPPEPDRLRCYAGYPRLCVIALSDYHRSRMPGLTGVAVVPNGIDAARFPFRPHPGDYLLFLGHLVARKGPLDAIRLARLAGMPLVLAGAGEGEWYEREVRPLLDPPAVQHVGTVAVAERNRLLAGAAALVFTSRHAEPFGLVLLEAMACGTPVVALDRCAVREIVEHGITGFHAPDVESLAALVPDAARLDRTRVRGAVEARFGAARLANDHERVYRSAIRQREPGYTNPT